MGKHPLSHVVLSLLAIAPVAAVVSFFRDTFHHHLAATVIVVLIWEILLLVVRFFGKTWEKLQDLWAEKSAAWIDELLRRTVSRYTRNYRYFLSRMHSTFAV